MQGRPHFACYNLTLETLINLKHHMADLYKAASHRLSGDRKDLLLRLAREDEECEAALKEEYKKLYICEPQTASVSVCTDVTIKELVRIAADSAGHFSHMHKSAPNKSISVLLKDISEKDANHCYLLLLIL